MINRTLLSNKISRRTLLRSSLFLAAIYPATLLVRLLGYRGRAETNRLKAVTMDLPEGISFHDAVIAIKDGTDIRFLTAKCTHLGCRINQLDGDQLVCPCHGSRFSSDGKSISGPASEDLALLVFDTDLSKRQYIVQLPG